MSHYLPKDVMVFFKPRKPLPFIEPEESLPTRKYTGFSRFLDYVKENNITVDEPEKQLTKQEAKAEHRAALEELEATRVAVGRAEWKPLDLPTEGDRSATSVASKTLFVGRLPYKVDEEELVTEFSVFGHICKAVVVRDLENKSRGYGFIEFVQTSSQVEAIKRTNESVLLGRRIVADVERGRTDPNWAPRRLGGGLGTTRATGAIDPSQAAKLNNEKYKHGNSFRGNTGRDRGERDRGRSDRDRGRGDRDRGRGDRGGDMDRGDRGDRDRNRDRYRDRDHGRDYDRDRDYGGRDRDRGRDYDREPRDREYGRDRDRGYNDRHRESDYNR